MDRLQPAAAASYVSRVPMPKLELEIVEERLPAAAPVSTNSAFEAVSSARAATARVVDAVASGAPRPPRVSLAGAWERVALAADADLSCLPADDDWARVQVPNNYGLEPTLSAHFGPVYYRRKLPAFDAENVRLAFDAVDYLCDAWIGEQHLGRHEGYFAPFAFDVTGKVRDGSTLLVRVQDPFEELDPGELFIRHAKRVIKGTLKYHDSRPGGLPGRHTPGWTARLGQSLTTGGITADLRLEGTGAVRVDAVFVTPLSVESGTVHVALVLSNCGKERVACTTTLRVESPSGGNSDAALEVDLAPGANRVDLRMTLEQAIAWWPRSHSDLGAPALYQLDVEAHVDGAMSDVRGARFGLRTAKVDGDPKKLVVNGTPVFIQALNYIPRQHFADVDEAYYQRDMAICADAHVNSLGVHGHVQCRPCYDAADHAGMLVFQDFALQWHYDSGSESNPEFIDLARRQIADMAYTFYNHPSIVYWACHNEPTALFVPGAPKDAKADFDNQVLDEELDECLSAIDTVRHVHRASGIGDDLHLYDGSLNGGDVYGVRNHKTWFVSEYGFWTAGPQSERWGDLRWPPDDALMKEWLSRMSFGPWTFNFTGLLERYPSMDSWRRATEHYGALLGKYQTEWIRIHRGDPFFAYRWHFFCDWWGWAGGGLVDVDREPKATYHAFRLASRPLLVCTSLPHTVVRPGEELEFPIHVVNESRQAAEVEIFWSWHPAPSSLVIGADEEVGKKYELFNAATPKSMVAMPQDGPLGPPPSPQSAIAKGEIVATAPPESSTQVGSVKVVAPDALLTGATLCLRWGEERNWYHVLAAEEDWFCGPGAFIVTAGGAERLA